MQRDRDEHPPGAGVRDDAWEAEHAARREAEASAARLERLVEAERRARADAQAARDRLAFLDALSAHLAASEREPELLSGVARLSVPALGEWAGLFVAGDRGVALAAEAGSAPLGAGVVAHLRARGGDRLGAACRCAPPALVDDVPADPGGGAAPLAAVAALCLGGRSLGAIAVARAERGAGDLPGALALLGDVGRRTALAVEHGRLLRDARRAARAHEDFLHVASHELRGPLGTLRLTLELLARDVKHGNADAILRRLHGAGRQAQRLARLSDTLLDVSRLTAGRLELAPEEGDLAALVHEVVARTSEDVGGAASAIAVEADVPVRCTFDPARVDQVVSNLLSNALKYGCGRPVRIAVREEGGAACLEVEDHGIGIASEHQERIFERFERAVPASDYGGIGLGLWIARRIVEAHGGALHVRSVPGEGSTFRVELPLEPGPSGPPPSAGAGS